MAFHQTLLAYLLLLILSLSAIHGGTISKRRAGSFFDNELAEKAALVQRHLGHVYGIGGTGMSDYTNKLILRLVDAAIEDARDRGASVDEVEDMMRKRSGLRKCFFHAVNCW